MSARGKVKFSDVAKSVAAAFFGVQSNKNRERDFTHGKPIHYVVFGIVATACFVVLMWSLVKLFLALALDA